MLTVTDYFCGAGGSSSGMEQVPGVQVVMAANHWDLAIETHNANLPHADHDVADIAQIDPRRHPATDIGWFSPECTNWTVAKGVKQDYDGKPVQLELGEEYAEPLPDEAAHRSRMLMQDVPRFTEVHRYRAVLVENVTDVLKWEHLDEWLGRMGKMGYRHRIVVLNSAFATALGAGAPQLRDRVYFVFWRSEYREPDFAKWTRPRAWCAGCGDVYGVYTPKPGPRRAMRFGQQYDYRCPNVFCRGAVVQPYVLPAAAAIDWSIAGQRIGDRVKPLQPKTVARIKAGLRRYAQPVLTPAGGGRNRSGSPVGMPMRVRTGTESEGIACPPFLTVMRTNATVQGADQPLHTLSAGGGHHGLVEPMLVPVEGREGKQARPVTAPMRAQTARHENALVIPLRNNGVARPAADHPLVTFAAGGTHQGLVMRNNTPRWDHALFPYDGRALRSVGQPMPAQTTVQGDALLGTAVAVDDCTFRMLDVDEIRAGMAFTKGYILLGNKRERVRMLGNAVTPCSARDLVAAVVEAITGDDIDLASPVGLS
jgi:DNA (cytosine-5)-methyltransferase 1